MRHLHLVVDHEPAPTDFPPTWDEFVAARERFLTRLATPEAEPRRPVPAPTPQEAPRP